MRLTVNRKYGIGAVSEHSASTLEIRKPVRLTGVRIPPPQLGGNVEAEAAGTCSSPTKSATANRATAVLNRVMPASSTQLDWWTTSGLVLFPGEVKPCISGANERRPPRPAPHARPEGRDDLHRVLIRDQADRDAISSRLMRYRDQNGQDWADIIDFLTMHPDARRRLVRVLGELEADHRTG
jgi:hypothetical protein